MASDGAEELVGAARAPLAVSAASRGRLSLTAMLRLLESKYKRTG
jgi:hypothetical protein